MRIEVELEGPHAMAFSMLLSEANTHRRKDNEWTPGTLARSLIASVLEEDLIYNAQWPDA